jgi:hypothetical protein
MDNEKLLDLPQEFIVLAIPASTVDLDIHAKIMKDGELVSVKRTMRFEEIREAIEDARTGYIPEDAIFSLTPLGERVAEELMRKYKDQDLDLEL